MTKPPNTADKPQFPTADIDKLDEWNVVRQLGAICRRYPKAEKTKGGLHIPNSSQESPPGLAWILAMRCEAISPDPDQNFRVGDTIMVPEYLMAQGPLEGFGYEPGELFFLNDISEEAVMHWPAPKEKGDV